MAQILSTNKWLLKYKDNESADFGEIPCVVPGNVEFDFINAGLLPKDIFMGQNICLAEKYEGYDYEYSTFFDCENPDKPHRLIFKGVDTVAEYFVNGEKIGESKNMFVEHVFKITAPLKEKDNELKVVIHSTCIYAHQQSHEAFEQVSWSDTCAEYTGVRKPAHTFGWDIMPRAISAGIWKDVILEEIPEWEIAEFYLAVKSCNVKSAVLFALFRVETPEFINNNKNIFLEICGKCGDSTFAVNQRLPYKAGKVYICVKDVKLWWPKGYGDANLYDVEVLLKKNDEILAKHYTQVGIRSVKLLSSETAMEDKAQFCFEVNGEKIFAKGVNWSPLSPYHSEDIKRLPKALELVEKSNANIVRCWGGNVYESDEFYQAMDKMGVMVWQDFGFACSPYPLTKEFFEEIEEEVGKVVRRLRGHASIVLWAGDNEVDAMACSTGVETPENNVLTREILPRIVHRHDPYRQYLPSSPYVSERAFELGKKLGIVGDMCAPEQHLWGEREWYRSDYYRQSKACFVSEVGLLGCAKPSSLEKWVGSEQLNNRRGLDWMLHSSNQVGNFQRVEAMEKHVRLQFGEKAPADYKEFSLLSRLVQAEGVKYFVESMRQGKPKKSGIILWNLIEGWPGNTEALVDWYFEKKESYYTAARSFQPVLMMIYENINGRYALKILNDTLREVTVKYKVYDADTQKVFVDGQTTVDRNGVKELDVLRGIFFSQRMLIIEWEMQGKTYFNHFITGFPEYKKEDMIRWYDILRGKGLIEE